MRQREAQLTAKQFPDSDLIERPVAIGQFFQIKFEPASLLNHVLPQIFKSKTAYGHNPLIGLKDPKDPSKGKKRILIEFSSPNIAKPFHAGHLRSTIIGGFLSHLYDAAGYEVIKLNYLGDWGKQYGLLALAYTRHGDEEALKANPIGHLFDLYVKINAELTKEKEEVKKLDKESSDLQKLQAEIKKAEEEGVNTEDLKRKITLLEEAAMKSQTIKDEGLDEQARRYFKKMCDGDEQALDLWRRMRDLSIVRYKRSYARLNIEYDHYLGESLVKQESMDRVERELDEAGLAEMSQGAKLIDFEKLLPGKPGKQLGKALIKKKDGTSLYLTRDLGAIQERDERWHFDRMIYVVASDQTVHLNQLFKTTELCGHKDLASRCSHVSFGLVQGMSTRRGTVKFLDDILRDVGDHMHEVMRQNKSKYDQVQDPAAIADILGISSVMVQDMSGKIINNYDFSMDAMTSLEGDTGPYLQYAHARLCSIFRKADIPQSEIESADLSLLTESHAINIVRLLARYPDTIITALKTHEPTTVLTFLFRMTHALSSSYDHLKVLGSEPKLLRARLALYEAVRIVLGNGMRLLGLTPVERYVMLILV